MSLYKQDVRPPKCSPPSMRLNSVVAHSYTVLLDHSADIYMHYAC